VIAQTAEADGVVARLRRLSDDLGRQEAEAELCRVGGAVIVLCFNALPSTRRITALFRPESIVREAAARLAEQEGLTPDWLNDAARQLVPAPGLSAPFLEAPNLRVFSARGDYVFAMKCASLGFETDQEERRRIEADLRYLLRYLDIHRVNDAMSLLSDYLPRRYLPDDLDDRIDRLLGS